MAKSFPTYGSSWTSHSADGHSRTVDQRPGTSAATNLVPGDTNGVADVFVKDLATGAVERVSMAADGTEANGATSTASLSRDGRVAFAAPATNLVPGDTNDVADVFLRRTR
ncbi:hypothetical protein [Streptomyces sp. NPDC058371]|uniref:hypothetical protein n=1 Tax=Streptomyces sp. NPDC058371 TaxID=3346463 RepID=UPI00365D4387